MTVSAGNNKLSSMCNRLKAKPDRIYFFLTSAWVCVCACLYFVLCINPVCDYDESYTVSMVSHSFREIISITSQDVHSPFYYFLVKLVSFLPGVDYIRAAKLFSCICAVLFLALSAAALKRRYNSRTAFDFVFLSSVTPIMISQVCNARMYTAGLLFYAISIYEGWQLTKEIKRNRLIVFIISSVFTVYLHHVFMTMMVLAYLIFIIVSLLRKNIKLVRTYILSGIATGISFLPWFFVMIGQFKNRNETASIMYSLNNFELYKQYIYAWKDELFSGRFYDYGWMIRFWMCALIILLPCLFLHLRRDKKDLLPLIGPLIMALTFMIPGILLVMYSGQFFARYAFPGFAGLWLYMAVSMSDDNFKNKAVKICFGILRIGILAGALYFGIMTYKAQYNALDESGIEEYRKIMSEVSENDAVMFSDTWSSLLQIYDEDKDYWIYGYNPKGMPFYYTGVYTSVDMLDDYETIWLVGNDTVEIANLEPDFTLKNRLEFDHHSYHFIVKVYEKS